MIVLRHFEQKDVESIHNSLYPDLSETDIREMIAEWNSYVYQGRYFEMFAVLSDNRIVGYGSISEKGRNIASAGIEIYSEERGKGFGSDAMAALLEKEKKKGYRIILDQVRKDNQASIRLHENLGFDSDGYVYRNRKNNEVLLYLKVL